MARNEAKVTTMVLNVDLQCPDCFMKVKKVFGQFLEIRDQVYDDKANKVTIKVVCCSPEKIRDKLCYEGGRSIKSIEIKEEKPNEKQKKPKQERPADKPKKNGKQAAGQPAGAPVRRQVRFASRDEYIG